LKNLHDFDTVRLSIAGGLVGEDNLRIVDQSACNRDVAVATGKLAR
jgi:hypothetical protein